MMLPDDSQALAFALMLQSGLPAAEAILYFTEDISDPNELAAILKKWQSSTKVKRAMLTLMRKPWQELSLDEKITTALNNHYSQLAYLLFSHNYIEVGSAEKTKLDTARVALEQKLAGMSGKTDALTRFFDDIASGKLHLNPIVPNSNPLVFNS